MIVDRSQLYLRILAAALALALALAAADAAPAGLLALARLLQQDDADVAVLG